MTEPHPTSEPVEPPAEQAGLSTQDSGSGTASWVRVVVGFLISLVCLGFIFTQIDLQQFAAAWRLADYRWVLASMLATVAWLVVRTVAWRVLLKNKAAFSHVFFAINQGYLLNNLLPFRLGEVGRAFLLGRKSRLGFWQVLPTIFIERIVDLIMAVGVFLATLPFVVGAEWAGGAIWITGAVMLLGLGLLFILAHNRPRVQSLAEAAGKRIPLVGRLARRSLPAFLEGLSVLVDVRLFLLSLAWLSFNWVIGVVQFHLAMLAFFPQAQPLWSTFTLGAAALGLAAPSSPGGVGVYEFAIMTALAQFVKAPAAAAAFAFTAHLTQILITGVIGAYALYRDGDSLANLYRQVRRLPK
ncbi:MAG: flippase-like domain-containing protein [Anaerolineales bacterium]|nr:flippase-like domain-containing protein [Anaerolineales bacterium]